MGAASWWLVIPTILGTLLVVGGVGFVIWLKNKGDWKQDDYKNREEILTREFAVDVTAINVRTQDSLRADIQATGYVYINQEDKSKAKNFFGEGDEINFKMITNAVTKRLETTIREVIGQHNLADLHNKRQKLSQDIKPPLQTRVNDLGLKINDIVIGNIEENENYSANNYFDAQILVERTKTIQEVIRQCKIEELETREAVSIQELATEKSIKIEKLNTEKEIRHKELTTGREIENEEIKFATESLTENEKIEKSRLNKEKEIDVLRLQVDADIQVAEEQENTKVEQEKIKQDLIIAEENRKLQLRQAAVQQELETKELDVLIAILKKQQEKLTSEQERAKAQEEVNTAIEQAKANCRYLTAQKAAEAAKEEAKAIEALAKAEGGRYKLIPPNDAARMAQIIQELAPKLMDKLPELAEALAPKSGVLGNSNIYTFPGGNGEGVNQLMLSTSGMLLLNTLMEGKLGKMLEQTLQSVKEEKNGHIS